MKLHYNWNEAPLWANYAARDSNGFARWFESVPTPCFEYSRFIEWRCLKNSTQSDCNPFWRERSDCPDPLVSLEMRPTSEQIEQSEKMYANLDTMLTSVGLKANIKTWKLEQDYLSFSDSIYRLKNNIPTDPLFALVGKDISVKRTAGVSEVIVSIFRNKIDDTYSFINHTKSHVCTCKFGSVLEAITDLEEQVTKNKVFSWHFI